MQSYDVCLEWFDAVTDKKDKTEGKRPNRSTDTESKIKIGTENDEVPIHERPELQNILNDIQKRTLVISRAENQRKHRKKKRQARRAFNSNPYAKKRFGESKSGKLDVAKEELENHLRMTYSDDLNGTPIPPLRDLPKPQDLTVMFDDSGIKLKEV